MTPRGSPGPHYNAGEPQRIAGGDDLDKRLRWIGPDDRGLTLKVIGIQLPDHLLIIHLKPYGYRRRT